MSFRRKYHSVPLGRDQFYIDVRYTNLRPIGGGSYGVVCSADDTATGRRVAIKKIANVFSDLVDAKCASASPRARARRRRAARRRILREIKLLRHFGSHENIVQVKDIITVPPNTIDFSDVYIVTNLMERARRVLCGKPGTPRTAASTPGRTSTASSRAARR